MTSIISVGYERRTVNELISVLTEHGVEKLIDVRQAPISRKPGFSKSALNSRLAAVDIDYVHIKAAGNPHRKKKANVELCLRLYQGHLDEHPEVLETVGAQFSDTPTAMLCYERSHASCHRSILLNELLQKGYITEIIKVE